MGFWRYWRGRSSDAWRAAWAFTAHWLVRSAAMLIAGIVVAAWIGNIVDWDEMPAFVGAVVILIVGAWLWNLARAPWLRDRERQKEIDELRARWLTERSILERQAATLLRRFEEWPGGPIPKPFQPDRVWDLHYDRFAEALAELERVVEGSDLPIAEDYIDLCTSIRRALSSAGQEPTGKQFWLKLSESRVMLRFEALAEEAAREVSPTPPAGPPPTTAD